MNKNIIIAIISTTISAGLCAGEFTQPTFWGSSGEVARNLVSAFDRDGSDALNSLELSGAVDFLSKVHPILNERLDYTNNRSEVSSAPKVAVELVNGFDADSDVQLTEEELSLAISYLRRLNRSARGIIAMAD